MPFGVERDALLLRLQDLLVLGRLDRVLNLVAKLREPGEGDAGEAAVAAEVAAGDEGLVGVVRKPATSRSQQLVDLIWSLPVVLGLVEHGQQHVQLVERVGQPDHAAQAEPDVAGVAPLGERLVERDRLRPDLPAQWLEHAVRDAGPAATRQHGNGDLQRDRGVGELLTRGAAARPGGAEDVGQRDAEQRRRGIRTVVDVLRQAEVR